MSEAKAEEERRARALITHQERCEQCRALGPYCFDGKTLVVQWTNARWAARQS